MKKRDRNNIILRYHGKTSFLDEIVCQSAQIHVEQMSDECFWMCVETESEYISFNFFLGKNEVADEDGNIFRPIVLKVQEKVKK